MSSTSEGDLVRHTHSHVSRAVMRRARHPMRRTLGGCQGQAQEAVGPRTGSRGCERQRLAERGCEGSALGAEAAAHQGVRLAR